MASSNKPYIELHTHIGDDADKMCYFLNSNRIGYNIGECHHMFGNWDLPDRPHYTNVFHIQGYSESKMQWVKEKLKECKHITFHFNHITMVEKDDRTMERVTPEFVAGQGETGF